MRRCDYCERPMLYNISMGHLCPECHAGAIELAVKLGYTVEEKPPIKEAVPHPETVVDERLSVDDLLYEVLGYYR